MYNKKNSNLFTDFGSLLFFFFFLALNVFLGDFHHYLRFNNYMKGGFQIYFLSAYFIPTL